MELEPGSAEWFHQKTWNLIGEFSSGTKPNSLTDDDVDLIYSNYSTLEMLVDRNFCSKRKEALKNKSKNDCGDEYFEYGHGLLKAYRGRIKLDNAFKVKEILALANEIGAENLDENANLSSYNEQQKAAILLKEDLSNLTRNLALKSIVELVETKTIFESQLDKADDEVIQLKLANTLEKLGQALYECKQYGNALKELNECLKIRQKVLSVDARLIAKTYYHIGQTYLLASEKEEAELNFKKAVDIINEAIDRSDNDKIKNNLASFLKEVKFFIDHGQTSPICLDEIPEKKIDEVIDDKELVQLWKDHNGKFMQNVKIVLKKEFQKASQESEELNGNS